MSAAASRDGRIRRREEQEEKQDVLQAPEIAHTGSQPNNEAVGAAMIPSQSDPSAAAAQPQSAGVQPLPEQFSQCKRPQRSARLACHLDKLATVELQLCLQFLDTKSKLKAARCSRCMLQAVSAPFAWRSAPPFIVAVQSDADVGRICSSLLRSTTIQLRCAGMKSLQCVATVPHLVGLDLLQAPQSSAADLSQLLQHPNLSRLQTMRLGFELSKILSYDTMRRIARLPQLHTLYMAVPDEQAGFFRPLADAAAPTNLALFSSAWTAVSMATLDAISQCAKLQRLCLSKLVIRRVHFLSFFSSPSMRQLQHLQLIGFLAAGSWRLASGNSRVPNAEEYRSVFSQLKQLRSLTLERVYGIDSLLPHLHLAPALRLLSIRCEPNPFGIIAKIAPLLHRDVLSALLAAAPRLKVRLLLPASLDRWMALQQSAVVEQRTMLEQQWGELQRMAAEMERVTVVDWQPPSA